jgi:hypothetical protein
MTAVEVLGDELHAWVNHGPDCARKEAALRVGVGHNEDELATFFAGGGVQRGD